MSENSDKDQKTEQPTAKKLEEAVKEGNVLQSKEFATALIMLAGAGWLMVAGGALMTACEQIVRRGLSVDRGLLENSDFVDHALGLAGDVLWPMASLFLLTIIGAFAAPAMMGSLGFRMKAMQPKGSKINPVNGLKRMFGPHGMVELAKSIAKAVLLGVIGYYLIASNVELMVGLAGMSLNAAVAEIGWSVLIATIAMTGGLMLIALIDVPVQAMMRTNKLKMTRQEVKDEGRQTEGSPEVKMAQRQKMAEVLSRSARQAVQDATVILTNPTHFAVALRYEPGKDAAPTVVGKGRDELAQAMRELAAEKDVPMLSYPELTRAIYFTSKIGEEVAEDLYMAVARVLAFVFNLDRALAEGTLQPEISVPGKFRYDAEGRRQ